MDHRGFESIDVAEGHVQYADDTQFFQTGCVEKITDLIRWGKETLKKTKLYFHKKGLNVKR